MEEYLQIHKDHNGVVVYAAAGANVGHNYNIVWDTSSKSLEFQNGPIKEAGVNGITNEALLAILIHRIGVLNSKFPCRENSIVLTKLEESLLWLEKRTKDRLARGVEGQHKA